MGGSGDGAMKLCCIQYVHGFSLMLSYCLRQVACLSRWDLMRDGNEAFMMNWSELWYGDKNALIRARIWLW